MQEKIFQDVLVMKEVFEEIDLKLEKLELERKMLNNFKWRLLNEGW